MAVVDVIYEGFPGKSPTHGSLGWGSITLVRSGGRNILCDTGGPSVHRLLLQGLKARGLAPADIDLVVITHAHWDHLLGLHFFTEAEVVLSRRELEWFKNLKPLAGPTVPVYLAPSLASHPRLRLTEGDTELAPGLSVIDTPGHTPGHISLVAETERGIVVMAGDVIKNRAEFLERRGEQVQDEAASAASIERIASMAQGVVPGHDRPFWIENGRPVCGGPLKMELEVLAFSSLEEKARFSINLP